MKSTKIYYILLAVLGILFFILNVQTPFMHDDYAYCFYYDVDSYTVRPTGIKVTGFWQMMQSMWHHYLCVNGRLVSHTILQFFCAFLGKGIFNICNTVVFVVFLDTLVKLIHCKQNITALLIVFLCSFCILPFPGQTMLWMTGSIVYLWSTTFSLLYLYWMREYKPNNTVWYMQILAFVIGLLMGWTQESITAPISLGLFIYFTLNRKKFKGYVVSSYIGYALGATLIIFGPGTFSRVSTGGEISTDMDLTQFLFLHTYNMLYRYTTFIFPVLAIALLLLSKYIKDKVLDQKMAWSMILAFSLFFLALGMDEERMYFGITVLTMVFVFTILSNFIKKINESIFTPIVVLILCAIPAYYAFSATKSYYDFDKKQTEEIKQAADECILVDQKYDKSSRFTYVTHLSPDRFQFHNRAKALYFQKKCIEALPSEIFKIIREDSLSSRLIKTNHHIDGMLVYRLKNTDYWLCPLSSEPKGQTSIKFHLINQKETLSKRQYIIRYLLNTLPSNSKIVNCFSISSKDNYYLIFPKEEKCEKIEML